MIGKCFFTTTRMKEVLMGVVEKLYNILYVGNMSYEDVAGKAREYGFKAVVIQKAIYLQGTLKQLEVLQSVNKRVFCILGDPTLYTGHGIIGRLRVFDTPRLDGKHRLSPFFGDEKR